MKSVAQLLDPCAEGFSEHVCVDSDGMVKWLTEEGQKLVRQLHLNDEKCVTFRRRMMAWVQSASEMPTGPREEILRDLLGYPVNLPDLSRSRVPWNSKPEGLAKCHFERRKRGELPDTY